jgi:hypothetical protein
MQRADPQITRIYADFERVLTLPARHVYAMRAGLIFRNASLPLPDFEHCRRIPFRTLKIAVSGTDMG